MDMKRKTSILWSFFTPKSEVIAECSFCKDKFSYKSSISNLKQHLRRKHPGALCRSDEQPSQSSESHHSLKCNLTESTFVSTSTFIEEAENEEKVFDPSHKKFQPDVNSIKSSIKHKTDDALIRLIVKDFHPFSIVEGEGFRSFINALNPLYKLPNKRTLSKTLLPAKYMETLDKTKTILANTNIQSATITVDCWTSCEKENHIAVTLHYIDSNFQSRSFVLDVKFFEDGNTSDNLSQDIYQIVAEWNLENKILLVISNNMENLKKTVEDDLQWNHLHCLAHSINIIVEDSLKQVKQLIEKVASTVNYFKTNTISKNILDFYQEQGSEEVKKLIQAVPEQWTSIFKMLQRTCELMNPIRASVNDLGKESNCPSLTDEDFGFMKELLIILSPMETLVKQLHGENLVTLSSVIIISNCLHDLYINLLKDHIFSNKAKCFAKEIIAGISSRLKVLESFPVLLVSTFLDPRFKNVGFSSDSVSETAKSTVINALTNLLETHLEEQQADASMETNATEDKYSIWSLFDKRASALERQSMTQATVEIQHYLEEPLLSKTEDPLEWWKMHSLSYPNLSELVKLKSGTVATSRPCQWIFSKEGLALLERRNRLSSRKVKQMIFINKNGW